MVLNLASSLVKELLHCKAFMSASQKVFPSASPHSAAFMSDNSLQAPVILLPFCYYSFLSHTMSTTVDWALPVLNLQLAAMSLPGLVNTSGSFSSRAPERVLCYTDGVLTVGRRRPDTDWQGSIAISTIQ